MASDVDAEEYCSACSTVFDGDSAIGCEAKCAKWFHIKCANISKVQFDLINKCKNIKWYCDNCIDCEVIDASINKNIDIDRVKNELKLYINLCEDKDKLNQVLEQNKGLLEEKIARLETDLEGNIRNNNDTYSKVLQKNLDEKKMSVYPSRNNETRRKLEHVVQKNVFIIKSKVVNNHSNVRKDITNKTDTKIFRDAIVKNSRNDGHLIVECTSKDQLNKIQKTIALDLKNDYDIIVPNKLKPRIKIYKAPCQENEDKNELKKRLIALNEINVEIPNFYFEIKYVSKPIREHHNIIIEIDCNTFKDLMQKNFIYLDFKKCYIEEDLNIIRCFHCLQFGHIAKNCTSNEYNKETDDFKCINCIQKNKKLNLKIDVDHQGWSRDCPCYISIVNGIRKKIDYGQDEL